MLNIRTFTVNPLEVNAYVVSDETGEAVLIDPGCFAEAEWNDIAQYINSQHLTLKHCLLTHMHFDHIMGCHLLQRDFGLQPEGHGDDAPLYKAVGNQARQFFGINLNIHVQPPLAKCYNEGDAVAFGSHTFAILHTPGHSPGCVCYYCPAEHCIFTGDTLFRGSMGRTDLQGGNDSQMISSLLRLATLPEQTTVYPGHGPATNIANERTWIQAVYNR